MGVTTTIVEKAVVAIVWTEAVLDAVEAEVPTRDADIATEAEKDKEVENEGETSGCEHPEILESVSFNRVRSSNPAPVTGNPIERPTLSGLDDSGAEDDNKPKEGPDSDKGAIADIVCYMPAEEEDVKGVDGDDKTPKRGSYITSLLDDSLGRAV